jgi:hypothetical protein
VDILSDELARARAQGAVFSVLRRAAPWGLLFGGHRPLTVHILLTGSGWIEADGAPPVPVSSGDVVLAVAGGPYTIVSEPGAPTVPIADARRDGSAPGADPAATVMCGAYVLSGTVAETVLDSIPASRSSAPPTRAPPTPRRSACSPPRPPPRRRGNRPCSTGCST